MKSQMYCLLTALVSGWLLVPATLAFPAKAHNSKKAAGQDNEITAFNDIPTLPDGPDKDCYVTICRKSYDVRILATNLIVYIYPKDKGKRIDKPIEFNSFSFDTRYKPSILFKGVCNLVPPTTNATKLVITAVGDDPKVVLIQTWKFSDNKLELEETVTEVPVKDKDTPLLRTVFRWPVTHRFTPNVEQSERTQAVAGYNMRWHAGKTAYSMRTINLPYAEAVAVQSIGDWVENQGPWGARKVSIKRKANKGHIIMGINGNPSPYAGLAMQFVAACNAKLKKVEEQGLEIKIE